MPYVLVQKILSESKFEMRKYKEYLPIFDYTEEIYSLLHCFEIVHFNIQTIKSMSK